MQTEMETGLFENSLETALLYCPLLLITTNVPVTLYYYSYIMLISTGLAFNRANLFLASLSELQQTFCLHVYSISFLCLNMK